MKNKSILFLLLFFSAGICVANAQSKQQMTQQKWKDEMDQRKKHREEILAKAHDQQRQLQFEKKPEQISAPVQQQPQTKAGLQQDSQQNVPLKKEDVPADSRKLMPAHKNVKREEIN